MPIVDGGGDDPKARVEPAANADSAICLTSLDYNIPHRTLMKNLQRAFGAIVILLLTGLPLAAENWPQWRGPFFNGSTVEKGLPERFSKTEQVKWVAELPGPSAATPVIWGDRVFVSSTDSQKKILLALCLERGTGKVQWQQEIAPGYGQDDKSNYASPSPVTDGKLVFYFYGNGELAAFDLEGKKQWSRNLQKDYGTFAFLWTFSSSPMLFEGKLFIQVLQRDEAVNGHGSKDGPNVSYLLALDPQTGKQIWKVERPSEAKSESREAFSTPIPFKHGNQTELLVLGGDALTGHDPGTGKELWRWGNWNPQRIAHWRLVPSPVAANDLILASAPKQSPIYAVKAGGMGSLDDSSIVWKTKDRAVSADVATPLFYQERFYVLNGDRKKISCVRPKDGEVLWTGDLESRADFQASPTGGDGRIFVMNMRGEVFVIQAGNEFKLLHKTAMGDDEDSNLRSSIAISQGNLFIRTGRKLYCLGS